MSCREAAGSIVSTTSVQQEGVLRKPGEASRCPSTSRSGRCAMMRRCGPNSRTVAWLYRALVIAMACREAACSIVGTMGLREDLAACHGDPNPMLTRTRRTSAALRCANPEPHRAQLSFHNISSRGCSAGLGCDRALAQAARQQEHLGVRYTSTSRRPRPTVGLD